MDGSEFPKKGRYAAGVARQYCGIRGKIDNCQAGVFLASAAPRGQTLLDHRLYLPEKWFESASGERWAQCGIPEEIAFRTKPQLAGEMIEAVVTRAVLLFSWVTCEETFGNNPEFLGHVESARIRYLADVSVSTLVWLERPETWIAPAKSSGRPPWRARVAADMPRSVRVDELAAQLPRGRGANTR